MRGSVQRAALAITTTALLLAAGCATTVAGTPQPASVVTASAGPSSVTGAPTPSARRAARALADALLPDSAFPAGARVARGSAHPDVAPTATDTTPASCSAQSSAVFGVLAGGEIASAGTSAAGSTVGEFLHRGTNNDLSALRDFLGACGTFSSAGGGGAPTAYTLTPIDGAPLGAAESLGFTMNGDRAGDVRRLSFLYLVDGGVLVGVVVGSTPTTNAPTTSAPTVTDDAKVADSKIIALARAALARKRAVLG